MKKCSKRISSICFLLLACQVIGCSLSREEKIEPGEVVVIEETVEVPSEVICVDTGYLPSLDGVVTELDFDVFDKTISGYQWIANGNGTYDKVFYNFTIQEDLFQEIKDAVLLAKEYPDLTIWENPPQIPTYYMNENLSEISELGPQVGVLLETTDVPMSKEDALFYAKEKIREDYPSLLNSFKIHWGDLSDSSFVISTYDFNDYVESILERNRKEDASEEESRLLELAIYLRLWLQQNTTTLSVPMSKYTVLNTIQVGSYEEIADYAEEFTDLYYKLCGESYIEKNSHRFYQKEITSFQYVLMDEERTLTEEELFEIQKNRRIQAYLKVAREEEL